MWRRSLRRLGRVRLVDNQPENRKPRRRGGPIGDKGAGRFALHCPQRADVKQSGQARFRGTLPGPNRHRFPPNSAALLNMRPFPTEALFSPSDALWSIFIGNAVVSIVAGSHDTHSRHRTELFSAAKGNPAVSHLSIPEFLSTASPPCAGRRIFAAFVVVSQNLPVLARPSVLRRVDALSPALSGPTRRSGIFCIREKFASQRTAAPDQICILKQHPPRTEKDRAPFHARHYKYFTFYRSRLRLKGSICISRLRTCE